MLIRKSTTVAVLGLAMLLCGCANLVDSSGNAISLSEYDSVIVEDVRVMPGVQKRQMGPLLKGHIQTDLLGSDEWKRSGDFNLDSFAQQVESYATTEGRLEGKPIKPAMTKEQFKKQHAKTVEKLASKQAEPAGTRPVRLHVDLIKVDFPSSANQIVLGVKASADSKIYVYDPQTNRLLGTADISVSDSLPGMPLSPVSMATRAGKQAAFGLYTRKHVLKLIDKSSKEIVKTLDAARKR